MASIVKIGSLLVTLAADVKGIKEGGKEAKKELSEVDKRMDKARSTAKKLGAALAAAFAAGAAAAIAFAQTAINTADHLGKAAQAAGVAVDEFSALKYAAEQSGVEFEKLSASLTTLNQNLVEAATNPAHRASLALNALGISARDAGGHVKSSTTILNEVASKFATYKDSAEKSAIATALFGSAGADLIPLLNRGAAGIAAMTAEARDLGIAISSETAGKAAEFNETLNKLWQIVGAVALQVAEKLLPYLQKLADAFLDGAKNTKAIDMVVNVLVGTFQAFATTVVVVTTLAYQLYNALRSVWEIMKSLASLDFSGAFQKFQEGMAKNKEIAETAAAALSDIWAEPTARVNEYAAATAKVGEGMAPLMESTASYAEGLAHQNKLMAEGQALWESIQTPMEAYGQKIREINRLTALGEVSAQGMARAHTMAAAGLVNAYAQAAGNVAGALSQLFDKNKAVAAASALINTFEGVTKALAVYGPTPIGWANAAAALAAGLAQVRNIYRTNKEGGNAAAGSVSGGSGSLGQQAGGGQEVTQVLRVQGLGPDQLFPNSVVEGLVEKMIDYQRRGGKVILEGA